MEKIKSRRCLSGILLISILAAVGCGSQPQNVSDVKTDTDSSTTEVTETTELVPDLPEYDGGGRDFTILAKMEGNMSGRWTALDAYIEEQTGDIVNDAVYDRNLAIEIKYNVNIKADYMAMGGEYSYTMYKEISKLVMAGDQTYDIIMPTIQDAADNVGVGVLNNHTAVFYTASGNKFVTYDENDGFTFTGGSERSINVLENILKIYSSDDIVINFGDA